MRITFFLIIVFLSLNSICKAQNYFKANSRIKKAEIAVIENKKTEALHHYLESFKIVEPQYYDYVNAGKLALELNDSITAQKLFKKAIVHGHSIDNIFQKDEEFLKTKAYNSLHSEYDNLHTQYLSSIDIDYFIEIKSLHASDQSIRSRFLFEADSICFKTYIKKSIAYIDSANFERLLLLCKKKGFPTRKIVGDFGFNSAWLLLWHQRDSYPNSSHWQEIIPFIDQSIAKKELSPDFYALFIDFNRYMNHQPQLYGTLFGQLRFSPEYHTTKIEDPDNLNKRRKEIGLPRFEDDIKAMQIDLPKGYSSALSNSSSYSD